MPESSRSAIEQAVDLLVTRRAELTDHASRIEQEVAAINDALRRLGVQPTPVGTKTNYNPAVVERATLSGRRSAGTSVRPAVQEFLDANDRVFSNEEITNALVRRFPDRDPAKLRSNVRSALFQMVASGDAVKNGRGLHRASKWLPTNAESPTVAAVGLSVPIPTTQEGGGASGTDAHRVRDDHSSGKAEHLVHDLGAPVGTGA